MKFTGVTWSENSLIWNVCKIACLIKLNRNQLARVGGWPLLSDLSFLSNPFGLERSPPFHLILLPRRRRGLHLTCPGTSWDKYPPCEQTDKHDWKHYFPSYCMIGNHKNLSVCPCVRPIDWVGDWLLGWCIVVK